MRNTHRLHRTQAAAHEVIREIGGAGEIVGNAAQ